MKKHHILHASASVMATAMVLLAGSGQVNAQPLIPGSSEASVVDGDGQGGFLISNAISSSVLNPNVINSGTAQIDLGGVNANVNGSHVTVGDASQATVFTNFVTEGGAGSGGGAGLGGVFFVDQGMQLTLQNVQFVGAVAKGGEGGGVPVIRLGAIAANLPVVSVDLDPFTVLQATPTFARNASNELIITGTQMSAPSRLVGAGAAITFEGGAAVGTIDSVTGTNVTLTAPVQVAPSAIRQVSAQGPVAPGTDTISVGSSHAGAQLAPGMFVLGDGIPSGTIITGVQFDSNNMVSSITLSTQTTDVVSNFEVVAITSFEAGRVQVTQPNQVRVTGGAVPGLIAGMSVSGAGIPAGTTITNIAADGTITFSQAVGSNIAGFSAQLQGVAVGSSTLNLSSARSDLVAGMTVSGDGIPAGTTITAINGNQITLSNAVTSAASAAIENNSFIATFGKVVSTSPNALTLASVDGLAVGSLLVGDGVPQGALITAIDQMTGVVDFVIDPDAALLSKGGSMNGLRASGTPGAAGNNGLGGSRVLPAITDGEGRPGFGGQAGNNNQNTLPIHAFGGDGGNGGDGSNGVPFNWQLTKDTKKAAFEFNQKLLDASAAFSNAPFPSFASGAAAITAAVSKGITLTALVVEMANWGIELANGQAARGGDGGAGGAGGHAGTFFGGGAGGFGGRGGEGGLPFIEGGTGGDGGNGGDGGFGAGGGAGGAGGEGGSTGFGRDGEEGGGGNAGFGGGVGSNGDNLFGGGGSGFGGAIFVRAGGALNITGDALFRENSVQAGSSNNFGAAGEVAGADLFMMRGSSVTLSPGVGRTIRFESGIGDDSAASYGGALYASGAGASLQVAGGGLVQFIGQNTYTGTTFIGGATLEADLGVGLHTDSRIVFNGTSTIGQSLSEVTAGVLLTTGTITNRVGSLARQIMWSGSGGFAAGDEGLTLNFGRVTPTVSQSLVWDAGGFVTAGSSLLFGSRYGTGAVTLLNNVNLNTLNGRIAVFDNLASANDWAVLAGQFSNGTLEINDAGYAGTAYFTNQNSLSGLTLNNGIVSTGFQGASGRLMNVVSGGYLTVNAGMVDLAIAERLQDVFIGNQGAVFARSSISSASPINNLGLLSIAGPATAGDLNNSGTATFGAAASLGQILNSGVLGVAGDVTAGNLTNSGEAWFGAAASLGEIMNSGELTVVGAVSAGNLANTGEVSIGGSADLGDIDNAIGATITIGGGAIAATIANDGELIVGGDVEAGDLTNTGLADFGGAADLEEIMNSGELSIAGNVSAGDLTNTHLATFGGGASLGNIVNSGELSIAGTVGAGNLDNSYTATFGSDAFLDHITNSGELSIAGLVEAGDLTNTGLAEFGGAADLGNIDNALGATITIGGGAIAATIANDGELIVGGDVEAGDLTNTGLADFGGAADLGNITNSGALSITGAVSAGDLANSYSAIFGGAASLGDITNSGELGIAGAVSAGDLDNSGEISIGGAATLADINNALDATITIGGDAIAATITNDGELIVGGNVDAADLTNTHLATFGGDASLGDITNSGELSITGAVSAGDLANSYSAIFGGAASLGDITNSGELGIAGAVSAGDLDNSGEISIGGAATLADINNALDATITLAAGATAGGIANAGHINAAGAMNTGAIVNSGTLAFNDGPTAAGDVHNTGTLTMLGQSELGHVDNHGQMSLGSQTSVSTLNNFDGGLINIGGNLAATGPVNFALGGTVFLGGNLTSGSSVTNDGLLVITGTMNDGVEQAAVRRIQTTGFQDPTGVVDLGGRQNVANTLVIDQSGDSLYSGRIIGPGQLVKEGAGTLALTGANTFSGGLTISAGRIDTTGGGTLADQLGITIASGAGLIVGTSDEVGSVSNAGQLVANANMVLANLANTGSASFNADFGARGNVSNAAGASLTMAAGHDAVIAGALTNAGTMVSGGDLLVNGAVNNAAGATMTLTAGGANQFASLSNSGTITAATPLLVSGAYVQNAGRLTAREGLSTGSLSGTGGTIDIGAGTFLLNQTANGTYAGAITGSGTMVKTGQATLTLAGQTGSFAPSLLSIEQGTLAVNGAGILDAALAVGVSSGASLALVSGNQTIRNLTGAGALALNGNNLTLAQGGNFSGTVSGAGNIQVQSGVFNLANTINSTVGNFAVASNSTMNIASTGILNAPIVNASGILNVEGRINTTTSNVTGVLHLGNSTGTIGGTLASTTTTVNGGGVLSGVGSVGGAVVIGGGSAGFLRPGNSPGVITFANLTLDNLSATEMEIEGAAGAGLSAAAGGFDQIIVTGRLALNPGSRLDIVNSNAFELGLGQTVRAFNFAPGMVSGQFGSVTSNFDRSVAFNIATGTVVGLGTLSRAGFETAISPNENAAAMVSQLRVSQAGGVNQYYGGRLIEYAASALASGNAASLAAVFDRASPEAYIGLMDHMKLSVLDNRLDLGGYDHVDSPVIAMTGSIDMGEMQSQERSGFARYRSTDHRFNVGVVAHLPLARIQVSYGRTDGLVRADHLNSNVVGDQFSAGASVPIAFDNALRIFGRFAYGDYAFNGTRMTNAGAANFGMVAGESTVFGGGFEYRHVSRKVSIDISTEVLGVRNNVSGFAEAGAGLLDSLTIHARSDRFAMASGDLRIGYLLAPGLRAFTGARVDHDIDRTLHAVTANVSVESANMTVTNPGFAATRVEGNLGAMLDITRGVRWTIEGRAGNNSLYGGRTSILISF